MLFFERGVEGLAGRRSPAATGERRVRQGGRGRRAAPYAAGLAAVLLLSAGDQVLRAQDDAPPDRLPGGQMIRGTVVAVTGDTLTLRDGEGEQYQVVTTTNTRVMRARQPVKLSELHVGDGVGAGGVMDAPHHTLHALFIGAIDADEVRRMQAELGKSYLVGRITAIDLDALRLTVHRPDGVNQVISVDEGTSFRRGGHGATDGDTAAGGRNAKEQHTAETGESITLADIKVGESLAAKGGLKKGVFVPTELHVYAGEGHRRGGDAGAGANAAGARP